MDHRKTRRSDLPYRRAQLFLPADRQRKTGKHLKRPLVIATIAALLLSACGKTETTSPKGGSSAGNALDLQAIDAGLLPDPKDMEFAGRYETRSELGTDKFCAVSNGSGQYDIGFLAVFGDESKCEAVGTASVKGENVHLVFTGKGQCAFDARYDGTELRFPGVVENGCTAYCSDKASLSGTHYFMVQPGNEAARGTLGREIERLCD